MDIKVFLRQHQGYNVYGVACVYTGYTPVNLQFTPGTVAQNWIDFTDDVSDRTKLSITFSAKDDNDGATSVDGTTTAGEFSPKKVVSGTLHFEGAAYAYIKGWLVDHVAAPLNQIDVRFADTACGEYTGYVIKANALTWCEGDATCEYEVTVVQQDDLLNCIQRTVISDNWQGWFQTTPAAGKLHPRFSYCTERRPNGTMVVEWWLLGVLGGFMLMLVLTLIVPFVLALMPILVTINYIIDIFTGNTPLQPLIDQLKALADPQTWIDLLNAQYIETAGCGREHPAPLIRDYIYNVCKKCGVTVDATTAPIFFAPVMTFDTNSKGPVTQLNDYFNACYLYPQVQRGVRRFHNISPLSGPPDEDTTTFYQPDNAPLLALDQFLDQIKGVFNMEWRLANGKLYIQRKDWWTTNAPIYDFSITGADRVKLLQGLCYEWNEVQYPASGKGLYQDDAADKCGHEAAAQMNSIVSYGQTELNPNFYGVQDKTVDIGATKFRLDGASTDYIYDAMQEVINGQLISPWSLPQMMSVNGWVEKYCNYALLLQGETTTLPKILIWDPGSGYLNARALITKSAYQGVYNGYTTPTINVNYPWQMPNLDGNGNPLLNQFGVPVTTTAPLNWEDERAHLPQTYVLGSALNFGQWVPGKYVVRDMLGVFVKEYGAALVNYPMYFEQHYQDTLWDRFHWIDDPRHNPRLHRNWSCKIDLCCDDLNKLQVLEDGGNAQLHGTVRLDTNYYDTGVITEITVNYDSGQDVGKSIELKGFC